ncbi:MAG: universal stress protein [Actinobacteria bacterium]|nr:universal stress protein [Actinomycetota bacterium]
MFKKIVIATDGSDPSLKAATRGMSLAKMFSAKLQVIYVIDQRVFFFPHEVQVLAPENPYFEILDDLRKNGEVILNKMDKEAGKIGVEIEKFILEGSVVKEIRNTVREFHADLLIIGAHGKTGEGNEMLGSIAQALAASPPCSLLIIQNK